MKKILSICLVLMVFHVVTIVCDDERTECTTGPGCFPDGQMPFEVDPTTSAYYCCLQRNMTEHSNRLPDKTFNCSCVLDLTLPSKILAWAVATRDEGRMCSRDDDCKHTGGFSSSTTLSEKFTYCCSGWNVTSKVTIFDSDKEEFLGCRCLNQPVPTPDAGAHLVPTLAGYNSTGESCHYDRACQHRPALKCESHWISDVTFCCYGSRGLVTKNDDSGRFTRCTCTDEIYGAHCEAQPVPIHVNTTDMVCVTQCDGVADEHKCVSSNGSQRCCPYNMPVVANETAAGKFVSCTCKAHGNTTCGTWQSSMATPRLAGSWRDVILLGVAVLFLGQNRR